MYKSFNKKKTIYVTGDNSKNFLNPACIKFGNKIFEANHQPQNFEITA